MLNVSKNVSHLADLFIKGLQSNVREEVLTRMASDGAFTDRNTIHQVINMYLAANNFREDLDRDDLERVSTQVVALSTFFAQLNEHARAFREGVWETQFAEQKPESIKINENSL